METGELSCSMVIAATNTKVARAQMSAWLQLRLTKINSSFERLIHLKVTQWQYTKWCNSSNLRPPLQWKYRHPTEGICECGLVAQ